MGDEVEEDPLEPAAVLWDIPISIARVDVESVADVFDPKNKKKQEQLLDHVSLWSQNLSASLSELLAWKDDCFELKALPLNMLSQLAIIMSRLVREKGEMIPPLHQALDLARSFITGKVVDQEVEALKAAIIQQSNELEMERMRRVESQRKLSAALHRIQRLEADQKMHRWANLFTRLKMRASEKQSKKLQQQLRSHNELLSSVATSARAKASAASGASEVAFGATTLVPPEQAMLAAMAQSWAQDLADSPRMASAEAAALHDELWGRDDYPSTAGSMGGTATSADVFQRGRMLTTQELEAVLRPEPEPEPEPAAVPTTDVGATKAKTRGALLGGLKSGALEAAVAKMEEDTATEEDAAGDPEVEPRAAAPGPPTTAGSDRPLTGMSTGTINLPLFPSTPPNSAKDVYTRDEYIDAKLLHAKQLHFVSEMYQKRIDRLERRIQHLAGKHVRLRGTISKEVGGSARRQRRSFAGKIVTDLAASEGNPAQQVMLPSVMVPKPPPQQVRNDLHACVGLPESITNGTRARRARELGRAAFGSDSSCLS